MDIHTRQFDAADEAAVKAIVKEALEKYGRLDIMFANAAVVGAHKVFTEIEGEEFMRTMRTNVLRFVKTEISQRTRSRKPKSHMPTLPLPSR